MADTTREAGRLNVFISYSRKDVGFVDELQAALTTRNYTVAVDREDIEKGETWWSRIKQLIAQADAVVFVMSPDSIASKVANDEVDYALQLGKRLVPLVWRQADSPPRGLAERNFVFADKHGALPFEPAAWSKTLDELEHAINLNDISLGSRAYAMGGSRHRLGSRRQARQHGAESRPNYRRSELGEQAARDGTGDPAFSTVVYRRQPEKRGS